MWNSSCQPDKIVEHCLILNVVCLLHLKICYYKCYATVFVYNSSLWLWLMENCITEACRGLKSLEHVVIWSICALLHSTWLIRFPARWDNELDQLFPGCKKHTVAHVGHAEFHNNGQYIHTQEQSPLLDNLFYTESHVSDKLPHCRAFFIKFSCMKWHNNILIISVKTTCNSVEILIEPEFSSGLKLYSEEFAVNNSVVKYSCCV